MPSRTSYSSGYRPTTTDSNQSRAHPCTEQNFTWSRDRFERVKHFLDQHLENLLRGIHDLRPNGKKPGLELSYVTMGYRGLCQLRYTNRDWFPEDGEEARVAFTKLCQAARLGRAFERDLVKRTAPYLIGEGEDPSMPGGF